MRTANSSNTHYNYEVILDEEKYYLRTRKCLCKKLDLGLSTIQKYLNKPYQIRKYKNNTLIINRVHLPIFETRQITY